MDPQHQEKSWTEIEGHFAMYLALTSLFVKKATKNSDIDLPQIACTIKEIAQLLNVEKLHRKKTMTMVFMKTLLIH